MATNGGTSPSRDRVHEIEISGEQYHRLNKIWKEYLSLQGYGLESFDVDAFSVFINIERFIKALEDSAKMKKILDRLGIEKYG